MVTLLFLVQSFGVQIPVGLPFLAPQFVAELFWDYFIPT